MTRKLAAVLGLLALGACSRQTKPAPGAPTPMPPAAAMPGLKVVADNPALLDGPTQTSIKIPTIRTLQLRLSLPALPESLVWATLELDTPEGAVYGSRHVPFSTDPSVKQVMPPEGGPHVVDVIPVKSITGGVALDSYFLVGGTALPNQEAGQWTIKMAVDGHPDLAGEQAVDFVMSL